MTGSGLLWAAMGIYGLVMWLVSPRARDAGQFFAGRSGAGRDVGMGLLVASVVISWIFAKSITNAANLGAKYGLVGAVAYAGWYLSIPVAGAVIYWIRTRTNARSLPEFLTQKYGAWATLAFMLVILFRLMNEVWSNTAVVGTYFGASGTGGYFAGALVFTALTLLYSLRGGLRSSILTDAIQFALGVFLLVFVIGLVVPSSGAVPLFQSGHWTLRGGVDLFLVALIQSFSYPFHDPVLTDRGFITNPRTMLRSYLLAGVIAAAFITLFGLVGVHGLLQGLESGQDAPIRVAQSFGVAVLAGMTVLMMVSAGSTLDSTLSSFSKAGVVDIGASATVLPGLARWIGARDSVVLGRWAMVAAVLLGSFPLFAGTAILKATTISGTMVLGLAPPFLLWMWRSAGGLAFHLGFWPGVAVGVLYAMGRIPSAIHIGDGPYDALLGANVVGTVLTFGGFAVGAVLEGAVSKGRVKAPSAAGLGVVLFSLAAAWAAWGKLAC